MNILVAGGAGFIGSHLTHHLLNAGHRVYCLDNLVTGQQRNVDPFKANPNFHFLHEDVTTPLKLSVDLIYSFACPASPPNYQKDPIQTAKTSFLGTLNLLELAKKNQARLIQASTSEVYGDPLQHPQTEAYWGNVNPIGIRSCYDEGKRIAETLCFDFKRLFNTRVQVIRIFNTYGPNMDPKDGRVVSNFINQALVGDPLTLYGNGEQTRSFCYVDDLVAGIFALDRHPEFTGPVNLGNPHEFTVKALAEAVLRLTQSTSECQYLPLPQDDPKCRKPNIDLARSVLGWEPQISLEAGLHKTITYFRQLLG
ncbi:MAG: UDP-glucuronic acid decarboxylase family protein [Candidatus Margulisiibacteriota bacterium]